MPIDTTPFPTKTPLRAVPDDYLVEGAMRWFELPDGPDAGKKLFVHDQRIGEGSEPERTVLLVHGNPECSYTYRHVRDALVRSGRPLRLVIPDHLGFGLSDPASFEMVEMHHAKNLAELIRVLDLRDLTLVVHDWGGPIGTAAFLDQPERVSGLVVLNSEIFPMPAEGLTYENYPVSWLPWCQTPSLVPDALWGGVAGYVVPYASPQGTVTFLAGVGAFLARHAVGQLTADPSRPEAVFAGQFDHPVNARSSKRFVRQTPVWGHGYAYDDPDLGRQDNHEVYRRLQAELPRAWGALPAAGFFGQWDPCGKDEVVAQWQEAFPRMRERTHRFPDVGHFIEEVKGEEIAAGVLEVAFDEGRAEGSDDGGAS